MTVSLCVIAYNEEKVIENIINDIKNQDYSHDKMEIILVDGNSSDNTRNIMEQFKASDNSFKNIQVINNPKRKQASSWNEAIKASNEDIIIRVDAHASIPKNFVSLNVKCIESGENIAGGPRPNMVEDKTPWKETLLLAESSMFGSSIAPYRRNGEKTYVKSMFHAAYKREVFAKVGGFNENLGRTEDNEIHYRIRKAGYKFCLDPSIVSYQHTRSDLKSMIKQKYGNGYWIGLTLGVCPECLSIYHFVPFAFVIGIIVTSILGMFNMLLLGKIMWCAYGILAIVMSIVAIINNKNKHITNILLPILFFILHLSYGVGTCIGIIRMPFWRVKNRYCEEVDIVKEAVRLKMK